MTALRLHPSGAAATAVPKLIERDGLVLISFDCMKLLPARAMLIAGRREAVLAPGGDIVATSSGTLAYGLALEGANLGHAVTIVSDPAITPGYRALLEATGARVEIVERPAPVGGYQAARLRVVEEIARETGAYVVDQYGDPANPAAYEWLAATINGSAAPIDFLVGTVGSGGSVCGTARGLRNAYPGLSVHGVDTHRSEIFGLPDGPRPLRGLGNSLVPANVEHPVFDEVHWIDAATAYAATRTLWASHGVLQGPTSGAAYAVACWCRDENPGARVAVILPDSATRYLDTVYDDAWVASELGDNAPTGSPTTVRRLHQVPGEGWHRIEWRRRSRADVIAEDRS